MCLSIVTLGFAIASSHAISPAHDHRELEHGLSTWMKIHRPREVSHDAELLRRRMLATFAEAPADEVSDHAAAIIASLDHSDRHVRRLAAGLLSRLEEGDVSKHAAALREMLDHSDESVRVAVLQALARAEPRALGALAADILKRLSDEDDGVRWAAVDALSSLEPAVLSNMTLAAIEKLMERQELSLAKTAVTSWTPKLEGLANGDEVIAALGRLNFQLNFGGAGG
jgi:HEAT repeat protein